MLIYIIITSQGVLIMDCLWPSMYESFTFWGIDFANVQSLNVETCGAGPRLSYPKLWPS